MGRALGICPLAIIVMVAGTLASTPTQASPIYRLNVFTNNGNYYGDPNIILEVEVSVEFGLARFDFRNESTIDSVVAAIYLEQGSLDSLHSLIEGPGMAFSWPVHPGNLPSGQTLDPPFSTWFSADADPPPSANGIDPGETLAVRFNLTDGATIDDVYDELDSAALRMGAHVISLPDGSSESVVTPEPATLTLFLGPAAVLLARSRRGSLHREEADGSATGPAC